MRTLLLALSCCAFLACKKTVAPAPDPVPPPPPAALSSDEFLVTAGGVAGDYFQDLFTDGNGQIYVTGTAQDGGAVHNVYLGNTMLTSVGGDDAVLAKYDRYGNPMWARLIGSHGWDEAYAVTADNSGNAYVAGIYGSTLTLDNTTLSLEVSHNTSGTPNMLDMFLARYDAQGREVWARQVAGVGMERPTALVIDRSGNLIVTGYYHQNIKFGSTQFNVPGSSFFVAKYTADGTLLWANSYGNSPWGSLYPCNLKLDNNDRIIITGSFEGPQTIGGFPIQSNGGQDVFTTALDASGNVQWIETFGGSLDENCYALALDGANNIYIGGLFKNTVTAGGTTISTTSFGADAFFARLSPTGAVTWLKSATGTGEEAVEDLFVRNDTLYTTGYFTENLRIENRVAVNGGWGAFMTKHTLGGALAGFTEMKLNTGIPKKIHQTANGYSIVAGYFTNSILYKTLSATSRGGSDLFLMKSKLDFQ